MSVRQSVLCVLLSYWFTIQLCPSSSLSYITYKNVECHMHTQLNSIGISTIEPAVCMSASERASIKSMRCRIYTGWHENPFSFEWEDRIKWRIESECLQCRFRSIVTIQLKFENYWNKFGCALSLSLCLLHMKLIFFSSGFFFSWTRHEMVLRKQITK